MPYRDTADKEMLDQVSCYTRLRSPGQTGTAALVHSMGCCSGEVRCPEKSRWRRALWLNAAGSDPIVNIEQAEPRDVNELTSLLNYYNLSTAGLTSLLATTLVARVDQSAVSVSHEFQNVYVSVFCLKSWHSCHG